MLAKINKEPTTRFPRRPGMPNRDSYAFPTLSQFSLAPEVLVPRVLKRSLTELRHPCIMNYSRPKGLSVRHCADNLQGANTMP